jgi:hypothetical protein
MAMSHGHVALRHGHFGVLYCTGRLLKKMFQFSPRTPVATVLIFLGSFGKRSGPLAPAFVDWLKFRIKLLA